MADKVWMKDPHGGEPKEVEAIPAQLIPMMVAGWSQCEPPAMAPSEEVNENVG